VLEARLLPSNRWEQPFARSYYLILLQSFTVRRMKLPRASKDASYTITGFRKEKVFTHSVVTEGYYFLAMAGQLLSTC
jgi:hypothetical protein